VEGEEAKVDMENLDPEAQPEAEKKDEDESA